MRNLRGGNAFVCIPAFDTPGRKDMSGAFRPEAQRLIKALGLNASTRVFNSNRALPDRRREVIPAIEKCENLDLVAFLCHGWRDGIQAGWRISQVSELANLIALACKRDATVALYCCDTGRDSDGDRKDDVGVGPGGKDGFASELFQELCARGWAGQLWAHPTTAHTTQNPFVRVWRQDDDPDLGDWAVEPHSELWPRWVRAVRETELRYRMLQLTTQEEIAAAVRGL